MKMALIIIGLYLLSCYIFVVIDSLCVMILSYMKQTSIINISSLKFAIRYYFSCESSIGSQITDDKCEIVCLFFIAPIVFIFYLLRIIGCFLMFPFNWLNKE